MKCYIFMKKGVIAEIQYKLQSLSILCKWKVFSLIVVQCSAKGKKSHYLIWMYFQGIKLSSHVIFLVMTWGESVKVKNSIIAIISGIPRGASWGPVSGPFTSENMFLGIFRKIWFQPHRFGKTTSMNPPPVWIRHWLFLHFMHRKYFDWSK